MAIYKTMSISKTNIFKLITLLAIGLVSVWITLIRMPVNKSFAGGQKIEASSYGVSVYNGSGNLLFSLSPLNDYYYDGLAKEHLENKLAKSNNGDLLSQALTGFNNSVFGKNQLVWNTTGENSKGASAVNYSVEYAGGGIKITRTVSLQKITPTAVGQVLTICNDCMVTDDKNRAYFNGDTVNSYLINIALGANKVPTIIGENQSFPEGVNKLMIIGRDGKEKMSIPVGGESIYLQDKWHILELKTSTQKAKTETVSQIIYFGN